ncbi:MAG: hypothetical protein ACC654_12765 [Acidimicrobiia bacterium]
MARQLELRARRLASGERPVGWKVGFGAPAALERFALSGPLVAFLTDATVLQHGQSVSISEWTRPVAEPEIAVHIGRDLPGGAEEDRIRGSITALGAAIELADVHTEPEDVEEILADGIYHRGLALGPPDKERAGGRLQGLTACVTIGGNEMAATAELEALTGPLIDTVGYVASYLADAGTVLASGDVVIMGSVVPPIPIMPGQEFVYELAPMPPLSLTFA